MLVKQRKNTWLSKKYFLEQEEFNSKSNSENNGDKLNEGLTPPLKYSPLSNAPSVVLSGE